jgi:hypothetical protein
MPLVPIAGLTLPPSVDRLMKAVLPMIVLAMRGARKC